MKSIFVIDANVILRYLLADHAEYFQKARDFFDSVKVDKSKGYIPESVVVECVYVLLKVYRIPRAEIAESLAGVLRYKGILNENTALLLESLRLFHQKNVDIVDALIHVTAKARGWQNFSFDLDLQKLEKE